MNIDNVKQIIQELARENYRLYSDGFSFYSEGGPLSNAEISLAGSVAEGYWHNRQESEIERDEELEITVMDYRFWVIQATEEAAANRADQNDISINTQK